MKKSQRSHRSSYVHRFLAVFACFSSVISIDAKQYVLIEGKLRQVFAYYASYRIVCANDKKDMFKISARIHNSMKCCAS